MRTVRLLLMTLIIGCAMSGFAQPKESKDWLVNTREHNQLKSLNKEFGFPDTEFPAGKAVVILNLEGANLSILAVGPVSGKGAEYAKVIDSIRNANTLGGDVVYSQEDDCASSYWRFNSGGFGKTSAKLDFNLKQAIAELATIEKETSIALSATPYTDSSILGEPDYTTSRGSKLYNLTAHPPKVAQLVSEIKIQPWLPVAMALWFILPGFGALFSIAAGLYLSKRSTKPMAERRTMYAKCVKYGTYGVLGLHAILVFATLPTRALDPLTQVWFGTRFTAIAIVILPIFMFVPILMMTALGKYETKLFGPTTEEAKVLEDFSEFKEEPAIAAKKSVFSNLASGVPLLLIAAIFLMPSSKESPIRSFLLPILFILIFLPTLLSLRKLKPQKSEPEPKWAETYLFRAKDSYERVRTKFPALPPMTIKGTSVMLVPYNATVLGDVVSMTGPMAARFTEEELDWVMAHELSHVELGHLKKRKLLMFIPIVFMLMISFPIVFRQSLSVTVSASFIVSPFLVILVAMPFLTKFLSNWMQKQEFEADALALERTGNVGAAVSALQKLTTQNTLPGFDQVDWGSTHPAAYKRIEKLRGQNVPPRAV